VFGMTRAAKIQGQKFDFLTVISRDGSTAHGQSASLCQLQLGQVCKRREVSS
jgi:hypothetical protein